MCGTGGGEFSDSRKIPLPPWPKYLPLDYMYKRMVGGYLYLIKEYLSRNVSNKKYYSSEIF
jgi:hypothetical protein